MNVKVANRIKAAVIVVSSLIMVYALFVSRDHITDVAYLVGLKGYQAETLFIFVDLPALIGKVLTLKCFADSTNRLGRRQMWLSGIVSLACNVASGWFSGGYGPAAYGVFIVVMFLAMENVVTKITPRAEEAAAEVAESGQATATQEAVTEPSSDLPAEKVSSPAPRQRSKRKPYGPRNGESYSDRHQYRLAAAE